MNNLKYKLLTLGKFDKYLDRNIFEKDATKSLYYLCKDIFLYIISVYIIYKLPHIHWLIDIILKLPFQFITGFFMWCIFVVGHDCGHNTFSNYSLVNHFFGEICHSIILLTPFYPWKKSHHRHHLYHNHLHKDYSYIWKTFEEK